MISHKNNLQPDYDSPNFNNVNNQELTNEMETNEYDSNEQNGENIQFNIEDYLNSEEINSIIAQIENETTEPNLMLEMMEMNTEIEPAEENFFETFNHAIFSSPIRQPDIT